MCWAFKKLIHMKKKCYQQMYNPGNYQVTLNDTEQINLLINQKDSNTELSKKKHYLNRLNNEEGKKYISIIKHLRVFPV